MSNSLNDRLATAAGRRDFDRTIAGFIRARRYNDAESVLIDGLAGRSTPIADAARGSTIVRITGWEEVNADCEWLTIERQIPITAIGLNLSNYNDSLT